MFGFENLAHPTRTDFFEHDVVAKDQVACLALQDRRGLELCQVILPDQFFRQLFGRSWLRARTETLVERADFLVGKQPALGQVPEQILYADAHEPPLDWSGRLSRRMFPVRR